MNKPKLLLVDADQVFYQQTAACQYDHRFDGSEHADAWAFEGDTYRCCDMQAANSNILAALARVSEGYSRTILCFTSTPNFRHDVLSSYKGGRVKTLKPVGYWELIEGYIEGGEWETKKYPQLEADDVMSIIATHPTYLSKYQMSIYSQDKDMLQVPDTDIIKPDGTTLRNSLGEANIWRYTQALTGDNTDGYKGLKGYGPVKAAAYLDSIAGSDEQTYIDHVVSAYLDAGYTASAAYRQINCANIIRHSEFDTKTMTPILKGDD